MKKKLLFLKQNNAVLEAKSLYALHKQGVVKLDGGSGAYISALIDISNEYDVEVISTHFFPREEFSEWEYKGVTFKTLFWGATGSLNIWERCYRSLFQVWQSITLLYMMVKFRPDVILAWSNRMPLLCTFLYKLIFSKKVIFSSHNKLSGGFLDRLEKEIIKRLDFFVPHGPYLKRQLVDIGIAEEKIYEFCWQYQSYIQMVDDKQLRLRGNNLVYIGRMVSSKGIFLLLDAFEQLCKRNIDLNLIYIGDGQEFELLKKSVEISPFQTRIKLTGKLNQSDMIDHLSSAMLSITPTLSHFPEGRCMSVVESILCRTPVVVPEIEPFISLVEDGRNGLVYEVDSAPSLAKRIEDVIKNGQLNTLYRNLNNDPTEYLFTGVGDYKTAITNALGESFAGR